MLRLPDFGTSELDKLKKSSLLIIGLGGLGSPAALYLAGSGIGKIGLADYDTINESNLHRQIAFKYSDIGHKKTDKIRQRLQAINPNLEINPYDLKIDMHVHEDILMHYDYILIATDDLDNKLNINDFCVKKEIPFTVGSVSEFLGHCLSYDPKAKGEGIKNACYRCLFHHSENFTESELGIYSPVAGIIGSLMASEAIFYLSGSRPKFNNRLFTCNIKNGEFRTIPIKSDPQCPVCFPG